LRPQSQELKFLTGVVSGHHAWHTFHPTTVLIQDDFSREPDPDGVASDDRESGTDRQPALTNGE
jgi:hypothetical protein